MISRAAAVEMIVPLDEGNLPGQIRLVTNVVKMSISIKNAGQREMVLVGTHPRSPQTSFQNEWLRSLLFKIPQILQQPQ